MLVKTEDMLEKAKEWVGSTDPDAYLAFRHRRFIKGSTFQPKGGITFCFLVEPNYTKATFSVAICSNKDTFSKPLGRQIAFGRLTLAPSFTIENLDEQSLVQGALDQALVETHPLMAKLLSIYVNRRIHAG